MTINELYRKLKSIDIETLMDRAVLDNKEEIVDANTASLSAGKFPDGDQMPDYRSVSYSEFKQSIGSQAPLGVTDLKLTGAFHSGFYLKATGQGYEIGSTDSKSSELEAKYGSDIFGIAKDYDKERLVSLFTKLLRDGLL